MDPTGPMAGKLFVGDWMARCNDNNLAKTSVAYVQGLIVGGAQTQGRILTVLRASVAMPAPVATQSMITSNALTTNGSIGNGNRASDSSAMPSARKAPPVPVPVLKAAPVSSNSNAAQEIVPARNPNPFGASSFASAEKPPPAIALDIEQTAVKDPVNPRLSRVTPSPAELAQKLLSSSPSMASIQVAVPSTMGATPSPVVAQKPPPSSSLVSTQVTALATKAAPIDPVVA